MTRCDTAHRLSQRHRRDEEIAFVAVRMNDIDVVRIDGPSDRVARRAQVRVVRNNERRDLVQSRLIDQRRRPTTVSASTSDFQPPALRPADSSTMARSAP